MLDQLFLTVNSWMTGTIGLALVGSFLWGMVSVLFSPCHLASIPLIIAYVGGQNKIVEGRRAAIFAILFSL
ncbi:MAG: cytochrome C biosynthesis protein, partial [Desulfocapsaceae bacterium]|nr:cytochrome C biosynthesis protein [Desulfocapsaceae bacterium]